uniref:IS66 family transposase n=1 Tax=Teredinibacter franksiae TaxID=2761453 RepID=UPI001FEBAF7A|nr:transposase [Teredinibacter franksiae]
MKYAAALQKENDLLREKIAARDTQIAVLNEQLKHLLSKRFGSSSEKISADQLGLFNEAEACVVEVEAAESDSTTVKSYTRKRKPRVTIPDNLPREDIIHDITETEKVCPHDGSTLNIIGSEDHEQLEIIPAKIKVVRHKRLKYACPCCDNHIVTAGKPKQPIEKSIASPSLLAYIAVQKYADALPLYRQSEIFKRIGIELDRTNMANWMVKCGELTQPLINLLIDYLHKPPYIHMDETTLQVLGKRPLTRVS